MPFTKKQLERFATSEYIAIPVGSYRNVSQPSFPFKEVPVEIDSNEKEKQVIKEEPKKSAELPKGFARNHEFYGSEEGRVSSIKKDRMEKAAEKETEKENEEEKVIHYTWDPGVLENYTLNDIDDLISALQKNKNLLFIVCLSKEVFTSTKFRKAVLLHPTIEQVVPPIAKLDEDFIRENVDPFNAVLAAKKSFLYSYREGLRILDWVEERYLSNPDWLSRFDELNEYKDKLSLKFKELQSIKLKDLDPKEVVPKKSKSIVERWFGKLQKPLEDKDEYHPFNEESFATIFPPLEALPIYTKLEGKYNIFDKLAQLAKLNLSNKNRKDAINFENLDENDLFALANYFSQSNSSVEATALPRTRRSTRKEATRMSKIVAKSSDEKLSLEARWINLLVGSDEIKNEEDLIKLKSEFGKFFAEMKEDSLTRNEEKKGILATRLIANPLVLEQLLIDKVDIRESFKSVRVLSIIIQHVKHLRIINADPVDSFVKMLIEARKRISQEECKLTRIQILAPISNETAAAALEYFYIYFSRKKLSTSTGGIVTTAQEMLQFNATHSSLALNNIDVKSNVLISAICNYHSLPKEWINITLDKCSVTPEQLYELTEHLVKQTPWINADEKDYAEKNNRLSYAEKGNRLLIDGTLTVEGKVVKNFPQLSIVLGRFGMLLGFEDGLIGMHTGESRQIEVVIPIDYTRKELAGKEGKFNVVLNTLEFKKDLIVLKLINGTYTNLVQAATALHGSKVCILSALNKKTIERIDLSNNFFALEAINDFAEFIKDQTEIQEVILDNISGGFSAGAAVEWLMPNLVSSHLLKVSLRGNTITLNAATILLQKLQQQVVNTQFDLSDCDISNEAIPLLMKIVNKNLATLTIDEQAITKVIQWLKHDITFEEFNLTKLEMRYADKLVLLRELYEENITLKALKLIGENDTVSASLQSLIERNISPEQLKKLTGRRQQAFQHLCKVIEAVKVFNVSGNVHIAEKYSEVLRLRNAYEDNLARYAYHLGTYRKIIDFIELTEKHNVKIIDAVIKKLSYTLYASSILSVAQDRLDYWNEVFYYSEKLWDLTKHEESIIASYVLSIKNFVTYYKTSVLYDRETERKKFHTKNPDIQNKCILLLKNIPPSSAYFEEARRILLSIFQAKILYLILPKQPVTQAQGLNDRTKQVAKLWSQVDTVNDIGELFNVVEKFCNDNKNDQLKPFQGLLEEIEKIKKEMTNSINQSPSKPLEHT